MSIHQDYTPVPGRLGIGKNSNTKPKLPVVGNISIGLPPDAQNNYPRSIDYFRASGNYVDAFKQAYPGQPNKLLIVFPSNDRRDVCKNYYEIRQGKSLLAEGDGILWNRAWDLSQGKYLENYVIQTESPREDPVVGPLMVLGKGTKNAATLKEMLVLKFVLPEVKTAIGVWKLTTHGKDSTIPSVISCFDEMYEACNKQIMGIPFDLTVKFHEAVLPDKTKKRYPVLGITANVSLEHAEKLAALAEHNPAMANRLRLLTSSRIEQEYQAMIEGPTQAALPVAPTPSQDEWVDAEVVEPGVGDHTQLTDEERKMYE